MTLDWLAAHIAVRAHDQDLPLVLLETVSGIITIPIVMSVVMIPDVPMALVSPGIDLSPLLG